MNRIILLAFVLIAPALAAGKSCTGVLLIMADDLRDFGGPFTASIVRTPHLDRLAARGTRFLTACAQYPVCNPSRTSMLLGKRCEQTGIVGNQQFFRSVLPDALTFPQLLRREGWTAHSFGKILHAANTGETVRGEWLDTGKSWDHAEILPAQSPHRRGEFRNLTGGRLPWCEVGILDGPEEEQPDSRTAAGAVAAMESLTAGGKPWLVAAGFHRPHDPFHAPRKYFEMYPKEKLTLWRDPANRTEPASLSIPHGWVADFARLTEDDQRCFLQAYLAGVSWMDAQVGRLLDTLDRLQLWDSTLVIFMGDHGYHLGERSWWNKNTLFDRSCRSPLLIAAPGGKAGQACRAPVELVDVFPTVADYCGVSPPQGLAGASLRPALADAEHFSRDAAFTLVTRGAEKFGQSVRTLRCRYTKWSDGSRELYDLEKDPEETTNLADDPQHAAQAGEMQQKLAALPPWPPADQSKLK